MNASNQPVGSFQIKLFLFIVFISSIFLNTCNKNPGKFTLGEEFIESQTDLNSIDTFSVSFSTVILDTVVTSGTGSLLIGNYSDDIFGKITSHSYFQIGIPESFDVEDDDVYDSLRMVIKYNNYFFGDTTQNQKISVHQLNENIELDDDDVITNETSFSYDPNPIGSIVYTPQPNNPVDSLIIQISDDIGLDLFSKLKDNSEMLTDDETFINYFHGLVLVADDTDDGSIIGFSASQSDAKFVLYTKRSAELTAEKINYEFGLESTSKQFNHIIHDFTTTQLSPLIAQRNKLSSIETDGLSFIQGGIGVIVKVNFPSLEEILLLDKGTILKAQLSISPLSNNCGFDLPSILYLYKSDQLNRMLGTVVSSTLTVDKLYNEETAYSFDVTDYLNDELADSYVDPEEGLLITLSPSDLKTTFGRLIVDARNQNTKLKIYYLSY
jgi:hypothetical protein